MPNFELLKWEKIMPMAQGMPSKVADNAARLKEFPHISKGGKWQTTSNGYWTGGFWVGLLWLCYQLSRAEKYLNWAYEWLKRLERRRHDKTCDLGFLFYPSFVLGYQITHDESLRKVALEAADTLCGLFHLKAGLVYNEIDFEEKKAGRTAIDTMMNLPLLWWAYQETGEKYYYKPAYQHCLNTIENLIRKDYSTIHVVDFDLETGKTIRKETIQGYSNDSCWSRGQAWAIYGLTLAYQATNEKGFLEVAQGLANYFICNLPKDYVPFWDFNDPAVPDAPKDSSAAAIACSGLLTLSELSGEKKFKEKAIKILDSLSTKYLADNNSDGILKHGCFHKPANLGVDESIIWGDYYFVEALTKAKLLESTGYE